MNRRIFNALASKSWVLLSACFAGLGTIGFAHRALSAYPVASFNSNEIDEALVRLFGTNEYGEDGGIIITAPFEAENRELVPFKIRTNHYEKLAVFVHGNSRPLALYTEVKDYSSTMIVGTLKMQTSSEVSCYVMKQGLLFKNTTYVRVS